jgi:hypothetical protein
LEQHRALSFPAHADSDELDSWLLDLLDTDAYYVGLASSLLAGARPVRMPSVDELDGEWQFLAAFQPSSEHDRGVHQDACAYVTSLGALLTAMAAASSRGPTR